MNHKISFKVFFTVIRLRRMDYKSRFMSLAACGNLIVRLRGLTLRELRLHSKVLHKQASFFLLSFLRSLEVSVNIDVNYEPFLKLSERCLATEFTVSYNCPYLLLSPFCVIHVCSTLRNQ